MARSGLRVVDLLRPDLLKTHIETACAEKNAIARALFGDGSTGRNEDVRRICWQAEKIRPLVADTG